MKLPLWEIICIIIYILWLINSVNTAVDKWDKIYKIDPESKYYDDSGFEQYFKYTPLTNTFITIHVYAIIGYLLYLIGTIPWNAIINIF